MLPLKALYPQIQILLIGIDALLPNSWCLEPSVHVAIGHQHIPSSWPDEPH